eukprot:2447224-Amphidinium_carterae.1
MFSYQFGHAFSKLCLLHFVARVGMLQKTFAGVRFTGTVGFQDNVNLFQLRLRCTMASEVWCPCEISLAQPKSSNGGYQCNTELTLLSDSLNETQRT